MGPCATREYLGHFGVTRSPLGVTTAGKGWDGHRIHWLSRGKLFHVFLSLGIYFMRFHVLLIFLFVDHQFSTALRIEG